MKKRIRTAVLLLGLLAVLLCACTRPESESGESAEESQQTVASTPASSDPESTQMPESDEPEESFVPSDDLEDDNWTPNY